MLAIIIVILCYFNHLLSTFYWFLIYVNLNKIYVVLHTVRRDPCVLLMKAIFWKYTIQFGYDVQIL